MESALFDELKQTLASRGATEAIDRLCTSLRSARNTAASSTPC